MAKLYFGGTLIGGDVEQADLDALDAKIDANSDAINDINTITIPGVEQEIADLDGRVTVNESEIVSLHEEIQIITNATVVGAYNIGAGPDPSNGEMVFAPDATDWTGTTNIKMAKLDAASHSFTYADVNVGDVIQAGSSNGKGLFEVTAVNDISGSFGDFAVTVLTGSAGHVTGERVSVTVGSSYDETMILGMIADNTALIGVERGRVDALEPRMDQAESDISDLGAELSRVEGITSSNDQAIQDLTADVATKFDTGTTTHSGNRLYASAGQMEDAVVKNAEDILQLSTGGNPAVDDLVDEMPKKVENYNYSHPGEGDGVMTIRVTSTYSALTADPNTLYVVI